MKTKEKIISVAIKLFNDQGTTQVTTNHIAAAAGISPGNLYYYFSNREEIIRTIFTMMAEIKDSETSYGSGFFVMPPLDNLEALFHDIMDLHWQYRFFFRELNTLLRRDAELKRLFTKKQSKWLNDLKRSIHAFIDAGIFLPMDKSKVTFLKNSLWIIGTSWHSFLDSSGKKITMARVDEGIDMLRTLLNPYVKV